MNNKVPDKNTSSFSRSTILELTVVSAAYLAIGSAVFLTACNNSSSTPATAEERISEVPTPADDVAKSSINTVTHLTLSGVEHPVSYTQLMKTGHEDNGEVFGALKDENGNLIKHPDGTTVICNGTSNSPTVEGSGLDHTQIIEKDGKLHMISQFECQVGAMYTAELQQSTDGILSPVTNTLKFIDQSAYKGGWVHCAGSKTPWNSFIGSEEYEPDARQAEADGNNPTDKYYASAKHFFGGDASKLNPYYYGWTPEVKMEAGEPVYQKHYAMGRAAHELAYVMPDKKTVYVTDDGVNDGFYRFVADTAEDLSKGTLYAAKWTQTSASGGGAADLTWIELGKTNDADIKALVLAGTLKFSDVLDADDVVDKATGACNAGYSYVNTERGSECLKFKDINGDAVVDAKDEALAAALETRRVAAMKGATTEFRKFEGFTFNPATSKAYIAMSAIERGMEAGYSIEVEILDGFRVVTSIPL